MDKLKNKTEDEREKGSMLGFFKKPALPLEAASDGGESDGSIASVSSAVSTMSTRARTGRKRAIMPAMEVADGSVVLQKTKRAMFLRDNEGSEDDVFDPLVAPSQTKTKAKLPKADDLEVEMRARTTEELGACIRVELQTVEKIADKSKNLKGDFVKGLRLAARRAEAVTVELAQRASTDANVERLERENAELRAGMADLSAKVEKLTETIRQQATSQVGVDNVAKPASQPSAASGNEWEDRFMQRMAAMMDQKLAAALKAQLSSPSQSSGGSSNKGPKGPTVKAKATPVTSPPLSQSQPAGTHVPKAPTSTWATVTGKKTKKKASPEKTSQPEKPAPTADQKAGSKANPKAGSKSSPKAGSKAGPKTKAGTKPTPERLPNSAAITLTIPEGSELTLAAVMATVKARVKLADVGIETVKVKKAITGGHILEVQGPDCISKADALAERMRVALVDLGVRVARPVKTGELRLKDLDDSVTPREVLVAVAEAGGCSTDDVRVGDIHRSPTALGTVWVRCPLACVRKLAAAKHVVVGWVSARVDYLTARPLQCFRCLEYGHVRSTCQSKVDLSSVCYGCGESGHRASQCTRPHKCPLCSEKGCRADHRMGSKKCSPPKGKRKPASPRSAPAPEGQAAPTKGAAQSGQSPPPQEAMEAS